MLINVPQYIDVEDKVAGPLTLKQLGWMIAMGIILLILWNLLPIAGFLVIGLPIALIFVALAFFKPYGQPMGSFVLHGISFMFKPKIYVWKRAPQNMISIPQKAKQNQQFTQQKQIDERSIKDLANLLDSGGSNYNESLEEILKKVPVKKA